MNSTPPKKIRLKNDRVRRMLLMVDEEINSNSCDRAVTVDKDSKHCRDQPADIVHKLTSEDLESAEIQNHDIIESVSQTVCITNTLAKPQENGKESDDVGPNMNQAKIEPIASTSTSDDRSTYKLRSIPQKKYVHYDQECDEDFSTDCSEYLPSPDTNKCMSPQSNASSLGGDFQNINKILTNDVMVRTPSTISNLSLVLSYIDFVASPSIIYKANLTPSTTSELKPIDSLSNSGSKTPINVPENNCYGSDLNETLKPNETISSEGILLLECSATDIVTDHEDRPVTIDLLPHQNSATESNNTVNSENPPSFETTVKTRKRKVNKSEWCSTKNKLLKNSGQAYEGCNSKIQRLAKNMGPVCKCKKRCGEKFSSSERKQVFDRYYEFADCEQQWLFISRYVETKPIKRIMLDRKSNRSQTIDYFLPLKDERSPVCKTFFLNTLAIGEQVVYTALEKVLKSDEGLKDKRGQHKCRPNKIKTTTSATVQKHIELFPKVESHYTRQNSTRQYLSEDLNISKMYRLYTKWFEEQDFNEVTIATKRQYETVFNTRYNFSFFKPKKDQCLTCSIYNHAEPNEKATLEEKQHIHLQKKEKIRLLKKEEIETADKNNTVVAIFDLQKVLSVPQSDVGIFHYKRKYPCYNFTVFDATRRIGYCYVWHYQIAKRGSSEIGSALMQYFKQQNAQGITNFSMYSDGCYGQNKNRYIFALYIYIAKLLGVTITHRFFETGHSQNEGDSMHACIERNLKNKVLYTPEQIYGVILNSKVTGEKYRVHELQQAEVFDLKELVDSKLWRLDKDGNVIRWAAVMEVRVSSSDENKLFFKYDFDASYSELDLNIQSFSTGKRRGRKRNNDVTISQENSVQTSVQLKPAYNGPIPISKALHTDLTSLCKSGAIPRYYHAFYESLSFTDATNENITSDNDETD